MYIFNTAIYIQGYSPHSAGDLAIKIGKGKDAAGHQVRDALCWAGSSLTGKAAPLSGKLSFGAAEKGAASPGPAVYTVARFPDNKFASRGRHDNAKQKKLIG